MHIWLPHYICRSLAGVPKTVQQDTIHIIFCFVDHFEPMWNHPSYKEEVRRVERWCKVYPQLCSVHRDSDGKPPQHTFFYPAEEYRAEHLDRLAELCRKGYGEVEIHLHHDRDTAEVLREKLIRFKRRLATHGLLSVALDNHSSDNAEDLRYGFIHGNWALDNSRRDGRWCGVSGELAVLRETGCYADFTFPSAPSETQPRKTNSVYYAKSRPGRSKSYNSGVDVEVAGRERGDLMIIEGPLALNWKSRKFGLLPRIETGDFRSSSPTIKERVDLWVSQHIHVRRRPQWVFVKIHAHGAQERDMQALLGSQADEMFSYLEEKYNTGRYRLHYATAREMYNIVKAAEAGCEGDPGMYRDYLLVPAWRAKEEEGRRQTAKGKSAMSL